MEEEKNRITITGYTFSTGEELCGQLAYLLDSQETELDKILYGVRGLTLIWEHADVSARVLESAYDEICEEIRRTDDGHDIALVLIEGTQIPEFSFDCHDLSSIYDVENITEEHYKEIFDLYNENKDYFDYLNSEVTMESIHREAMASDGQTRFFVAFRDPDLVGIANVILQYPRMDTVWIDSFMIKKDLQGFSYGSEILRDMLDAFASCGFVWAQTGVPEGFPAAEKFWKRNWFIDLHKYSEKDGVKIRHLIRGLQ
ncbi:MAG: GNAT family N-acetyltransferase [Solobacterium sp.]|nr:GNAT family N-acetyltransferase [Erysipelotrichaceae bacterium]MBQ9153577.1 GNAT family N-acetyltransferase [Solobacterium sp.]